MEIIIGCSAGLVMLLLLIHVLLFLLSVRKLAYHQILKNKWESMASDKENVDTVISEMRGVQGKYKAIEEIVTKGGVSWAHKLSLLSDNLPRGMWLTKLTLNEDVLVIDGSAISRDTNEIINVHRLTVNLKENEEFMSDFADLELTSIQRRKIKNVEIADFVLTMKLK